MKHNMKCIALIMSIVMLIVNCNIEGILVIASTNNNSNRVYSEEITVAGGEQFEVPVMIAGNTGMMGFDIVVNYNSDYITPVSVKNGDIFTSGTFDNTIGMNDDRFSISWAGSGNVSEDGTMFTIVFDASDSIAGISSFTIGLSYVRLDTFDEDYNDVVLNCEDIVVNIDGVAEAPTQTPIVSETESPEQGETYTVYSDEVYVKKGESVAIPVYISQNKGMMGFVINSEYDSELLKPNKVVIGSVLPSGTIFDDNISDNDGSFRTLWSGTDNTYKDGCLYTMYFDIADTAITDQDTQIQLSCDNSDTFDEDYNEIEFNCETITVHISESEAVPTKAPTAEPTAEPTATAEPTPVVKPTATPGGIPTIQPTMDPSIKKCDISIASKTVRAGDAVNVPVTISNNPGLMGFIIDVSYNNELIEPVRVEQGSVIPDGTVFFDSISSGKSNRFRILWSGDNNVVENGELFNLVFKVKEECSPAITDIQLSYAQNDTFDEDYNNVGMIFTGGKLTVIEKNAAGPTSEPTSVPTSAPKPTPSPTAKPTATPAPGERRCTLSYPDMDIKPGNVVSIPVSIDRNEGLLGFDVVVTYDSSIFTPISVDSGDVISSNSYLMSNINRSKDNTFRVIWSGIDEVSATGNLFNINMKVNDNINVSSTELTMEYSSEGTFDGDYGDVIVDFKYGTFKLDKNAPEVTPAPTREPEVLDPDEKNKTLVKVIETEGIAGETVEVPIVIAGERGFVNLAFEVGYDSSVLTLVDVKNDKNVGGVFTKSQYYTVNPYVMSWNSLSATFYSGTIATLVFEINEGAKKGEYPITVDYFKGNDGSYIDGISINYDENDEPLDMVYKDSVINVCEYIAGDVNGDGKVNNHDATTLLRYLADWDITVNTRALDVNGDGTINNHDATRLLRYLAGWDVNIQ